LKPNRMPNSLDHPSTGERGLLAAVFHADVAARELADTAYVDDSERMPRVNNSTGVLSPRFTPKIKFRRRLRK
jgi:hypothetical protein